MIARVNISQHFNHCTVSNDEILEANHRVEIVVLECLVLSSLDESERTHAQVDF